MRIQLVHEAHNSSSKILGHLATEGSNDHEGLSSAPQVGSEGAETGFLSTLEFAD